MSLQIDLASLDEPTDSRWSSHASEIALVFGQNNGPNMLSSFTGTTNITSADVSFNVTEEDAYLFGVMNYFWATFSKTLSPGSSGDSMWTPTSSQYPFSSSMGLAAPKAAMQEDFRKPDCEFWCTRAGASWCL